MPEANNEVENVMNPEQLLQLEQARADRARAVAETEKANADAEAVQAETRRLREKSAFSIALDESKVKFHSNLADTRNLIDTMYDIVTDSVGNSVALDRQSGKSISLVEAIHHAALSHPNWADGRSLRALRETEEGGNEPKIRSEADFKTQAAKVGFLKNPANLEIWEKLPATTSETVNLKTLTFERYTKLPLADISDAV
jgi:hypothetical protein